MSNTPDENSKQQQIDPRLRRFLRRAVPIIASERGINERSLIKIRTIAKELRLPQELYQDGLKKLKKIGRGQKLTRYEREFNRFLRKEFRNVAGGILTVKMEAKAIEIAKKKYQIPPERASELIAERSIKQNIGRISRSEAELHVEQMITDLVQNATFIDAETRQRLYLFGKEWGVEKNRIDSIADQIITQNRVEEKARVRTGVPWYVMAIGATLVLAILIGTVLVLRKNGDSPKAKDDAGVVDSAPSIIEFPEWWPETTKLDLAKLVANETFAGIIPKITSKNPSVRAAGYDDYLATLLTMNRSAKDHDRIWLIFLDIVNHEPAENARIRMVDFLDKTIRVNEMPDSRNAFLDSYRANALAFRLINDLNPSSQTRIDLIEKLQSKTGFDPLASENEYLAESNRAIANAQWDLFGQCIWSQTERANSLLSFIANPTEKYLTKETFQEKLSDAVANILEAEPDQLQHHALKKWLGICVENSTHPQLVRWIDLTQTTDNNFLRTWLAQLLVTRLGITNRPRDQQRLIARFRQMVSGAEAKTDQIKRRWEKWQSEIVKANLLTDISANRAGNAQDISNASHFATLGLLLSFRDHSKSVFLIDQMLDVGPATLQNELIPAYDGIVFRQTRRGVRTWDLRSKSELIKKLDPEQDQNPASKASAIKQLADLGGKISDLEPNEARLLAEYCLSKQLDDDELLEIQKSLPQMQNWLNLVLAFVDDIDNTEQEPDKVVSIVESLTGSASGANGSQSWKGQLKIELLRHIAHGLDQTLRVGKSDSADKWLMLADSLRDQYVHRCSAIGVSEDLILESTSLQQLQLLFAEKLESPESTDKRLRANVMRQTAALDVMASNGMEQFVIMEWRIAKSISQYYFSDSSIPIEVDQLNKRLDRSMADGSTLSQKLLAIEIAIIRFSQIRASPNLSNR